MSKELRHQLQEDTTHSDNTRMELESVIKKTRMETGGLSLLEVSNIIIDELGEDEAHIVAQNIINKVML